MSFPIAFGVVLMQLHDAVARCLMPDKRVYVDVDVFCDPYIPEKDPKDVIRELHSKINHLQLRDDNESKGDELRKNRLRFIDDRKDQQLILKELQKDKGILKEHETTIRDLEKQTQDTNALLAASEGQRKALCRTLEKNKKHNEELQKLLQTREEELTFLKRSQSSATQESAFFQGVIEELNGKIDGLTAQIKEEEEKRRDLKAKVKDRLDETKEEQDEWRTRIEAHESVVAGLEAKILSAQEDARMFKASSEQLMDQLHTEVRVSRQVRQEKELMGRELGEKSEAYGLLLAENDSLRAAVNAMKLRQREGAALERGKHMAHLDEMISQRRFAETDEVAKASFHRLMRQSDPFSNRTEEVSSPRPKLQRPHSRPDFTSTATTAMGPPNGQRRPSVVRFADGGDSDGEGSSLPKPQTVPVPSFEGREPSGGRKAPPARVPPPNHAGDTPALPLRINGPSRLRQRDSVPAAGVPSGRRPAVVVAGQRRKEPGIFEKEEEYDELKSTPSTQAQTPNPYGAPHHPMVHGSQRGTGAIAQKEPAQFIHHHVHPGGIGPSLASTAATAVSTNYTGGGNEYGQIHHRVTEGIPRRVIVHHHHQGDRNTEQPFPQQQSSW